MKGQENVVETDRQELQRIFEQQRQHQFDIAKSTVRQRKAKLNKLHKAFLAYRPALKEALFADSGKHPNEVDITEIYPVTGELKHAKYNLREWMSPHKVGTPLAFIGSSSRIKYEAKGVVLIISPWNFPVNLTFGPLVAAIAAGNAVMLKPTEFMPQTSTLMKKMIGEIFSEHEVALVEGGVETSTNLLNLPFNHIFFTGSPAVGKIVMSAAAKNLTSVTLELGGKSPTIIDESANIEMAARRTAWGKFVNNGQICIAPDHVYVHEKKYKAFISALKNNLLSFYSDDVFTDSSYSRIVNRSHAERLISWLDDAVSKGAKIEIGGESNVDENFVSPTVIGNPPRNSKLMQQEIFGPILPVIAFSKLDHVIKEINSREKPLALYIFSRNKKNIRFIQNNTRAGGTCINHNAVQYYNYNLPFGGSNYSGIGKGHGWHSFQAFSNARAIYQQHVPGPLELLIPPYTRFKQWLIDFTIKWL